MDNFLGEFFLNDFNAQSLKSTKSYIFRDFLWIKSAACG